MRRAAVVALCTLFACTPSNVAEAEKKHDVGWLANNGSPEAIAALGRVADDDKRAQEELEKLSQPGARSLDGGAGTFDVYLAVWNGAERKAPWAVDLTKRTLADPNRMNDMANAIKRGSPEVSAFVAELDEALGRGCDMSCGAALASATGPAASSAIEKRLADAKTRNAMCSGIGSTESSKDARAVFMRAPESSRDALACPGAAARIAAQDDTALDWLAKRAEPGLLRAAGQDAVPCDRLARLWTTVFASRDHAVYGALSVPLTEAVKRCPKTLDAAVAGALGSDTDAQTLAIAAMNATNAHDLPTSCGAVQNVARGHAPQVTKARAAEITARCRQ